MANELIINSSLSETRIVLMEGGEIQDLLIERVSEKGIVGNIYKGRVTRVLPGMQAAFVDIGLEKAAFLYVDDIFMHSEVFDEEVETEEVFERPQGQITPQSAQTGSSVGADGTVMQAPSGGVIRPVIRPVDQSQVVNVSDGEVVATDSLAPLGVEGANAESSMLPHSGESLESQPNNLSDTQRDASASSVEVPSELSGHVEHDARLAQAGARTSFEREEEEFSEYSREEYDERDSEKESDEESDEESDDEDSDEESDDGDDEQDSEESDEESDDRDSDEDEGDEDSDEDGDEDSEEESEDDSEDEEGLAGRSAEGASEESSHQNPEQSVTAEFQGDPSGVVQSSGEARIVISSEAQGTLNLPQGKQFAGRKRFRRGRRGGRNRKKDFQNSGEPTAQGRVVDSTQAGSFSAGFPSGFNETVGDHGDLESDRTLMSREADFADASGSIVGEVGRPTIMPLGPDQDLASIRRQSFEASQSGTGQVKGGSRQPRPEFKQQRSRDRRIPSKEKSVRGYRAPVNIQDLLKEGQEVLVQVAKDPIATKGARLTCHISLPGRHLVCMPTINHVGVSRRIERDDERRKLRDFVERNRPKNLGFIVRTAGGKAQSEKRIKQDVDYLAELWTEIKTKAAEVSAPAIVYEDLNPVLRTIRDWVNDDTDKVIVDSKYHFNEMQRFVGRFMPSLKQKVELYHGDIPIFDAYNISTELSRALERKVWLKSGGYIVVDQAEALVAIDVNTGRFVGKKNLEDTILKTNLEAVQEIAYQLRLRNCGGIIILDLIDMEREENRQRVYRALEDALKKDRARPTIMKISDIGLVEMTRKRTRDTLIRSLCEPCQHCEGKGFLKSKKTVAFEVLREIERVGLDRDSTKILIQAHSDVIDILAIDEKDAIDQLERRYRKQIYLQAVPDNHPEQFEVSLEKGDRPERSNDRMREKNQERTRDRFRDRGRERSSSRDSRDSDDSAGQKTTGVITPVAQLPQGAVDQTGESFDQGESDFADAGGPLPNDGIENFEGQAGEPGSEIIGDGVSPVQVISPQGASGGRRDVNRKGRFDKRDGRRGRRDRNQRGSPRSGVSVGPVPRIQPLSGEPGGEPMPEGEGQGGYTQGAEPGNQLGGQPGNSGGNQYEDQQNFYEDQYGNSSGGNGQAGIPASPSDDFDSEEDRLAFVRAQAAQDAALAGLSNPDFNGNRAQNNQNRQNPRNRGGGGRNGRWQGRNGRGSRGAQGNAQGGNPQGGGGGMNRQPSRGGPRFQNEAVGNAVGVAPRAEPQAAHQEPDSSGSASGQSDSNES